MKIYLIDLPQEELTAGAGLGDVARALDGDSMAAMAGLYAFGKNDETALERLAALAQNANVPLLSGLAPGVVGIEEVFAELRSSLKRAVDRARHAPLPVAPALWRHHR